MRCRVELKDLARRANAPAASPDPGRRDQACQGSARDPDEQGPRNRQATSREIVLWLTL